MKIDVWHWLQYDPGWQDVFTIINIHNLHTNNLTINYLDQGWQSIWLLDGIVGRKWK